MMAAVKANLKCVFALNGDIVFDGVNPFLPKGFPIANKNGLALDRVKSILVPIGTHSRERVKV